MKELDELWQMIRTIQIVLFKKPDPDIPQKWNCCEMPVSPRNLAQHIKDHHVDKDYQLTDLDKIEVISIIWILTNLFAISVSMLNR